jgi:hypothetical protein
LPEALLILEKPEDTKQFLFLALQKLQDAGGTYLFGCIAYTIGKFTRQPSTNVERLIVMDMLSDVEAKAKTMGMTLGLEVVDQNEVYF